MVKSCELNSARFYFADLSPLYDALYVAASKLFKLEYTLPFLYIDGPFGRNVAIPGEVLYCDKPGEELKIWEDPTIVPKYAIVRRDDKATPLMHNGVGIVSLQYANNPLVYQIFIRAMEAHLMQNYCVWYKHGSFASKHQFTAEFATKDNLIFEAADILEINNLSTAAYKKAKEEVDAVVRKQFLNFTPITHIEANELLEQFAARNMRSSMDRIVRDVVTSKRALALYNEFVRIAKKSLPSYAQLCKALDSNPWGFFEFNLKKTALIQAAISIDYKGDYRILQWEQEHFDSFFEK